MSRELIERLQAATEEIFRERPCTGRASGAHLPTDVGHDYYCQHEWHQGTSYHYCVENSSHTTYHQCRCGERKDGRGRTY